MSSKITKTQKKKLYQENGINLHIFTQQSYIMAVGRDTRMLLPCVVD